MAIGRSKVVIIGAGNVGTALAHHLVICNTCNNLVLINRNAEKAWAEVTDLNHSVGYYDSNIQISVGTYSDCIDADIVVLAVGVPYTEGMTRLDMLENAATVVASITRAVMDSGFHGIFLVITNPVDAIYDLSGQKYLRSAGLKGYGNRNRLGFCTPALFFG